VDYLFCFVVCLAKVTAQAQILLSSVTEAWVWLGGADTGLVLRLCAVEKIGWGDDH
jgi:hypothetical protein